MKPIMNYVLECYENNLDKVLKEKGIKNYRELIENVEAIFLGEKRVSEHVTNRRFISSYYALVYREILEVDLDELYRKK